MWRWWPSSWPPAAEPPGGALQALAVGVVVAAAVGNAWPPAPGWTWLLITMAAATAVAALRSGSLVLWGGAGLLLGLAATAAAPRAGDTRVVPVRFALEIRDGWASGLRGWSTRARVGRIEGSRGPVRTARELTLAVGGNAGVGALPAPGSRCEGAGELLYSPGAALRPPLLRVKTLLLLRAEPPPWWSVDRLRDRGVTALQACAGSSPRRQAGAALAAALVLGRQEALDRATVSALRQSGLAHILSVSGLHVVLVSAILWGILTVAGVPPRARRWLLMPALAAFALVAGGSAPVLRATAATLAYLLTRQAGRPVLPLPAMWAVVAGLVLLEPAALLQPGFQLSAGVSLALIRWVGPLAEAAEVLPRWLGSALAVAVVGQLASWPLVGVTFASVPPWGAAANLLAAPLGLPLVGLALVAVVLAPVGLAGPLLWLVGLGDAALLGVSTLGSGTAWLFAPVPGALAVVGVGLLLAGLTRIRGAWLAAATLAAGSLAWTLAPAWSARPAGEARLLPVGEGLALLLRTPGTAVLVDAGRSATDALRGLAAVRARRLDALLLTHADADHTGGAATLLERVGVGELVLPEAIAERAEVQPLVTLAGRRGVRVVRVAAGEDHAWGDMRCRVVWPPAHGTLEDNDLSLVAVFTLGGKRLLVTGDVEAAGEASVVAGGEDLRAEILQLPHHGSRTSSSSLLLAAVQPRVALAGTGLRPRFAYPDPTVRARVRALPALVLSQTGEVQRLWWNADGAIMIGTPQPACLPARGANR